MRLSPVIPVVLAMALLFTAWALEMIYVALLGFPDRATTEYDVAVSNSVWTFDRFTVAVAVWLVVLAFFTRRRGAMRAFAATVGAYAVTIGVMFALAQHYAATLPGPWGG